MYKEFTGKRYKQYRVFVLDSNKEAIDFWEYIGFEEQIYDYRTFQMNTTTYKVNGI